VPTATPWGMMILGLAFLGALGWMLRARRSLR
jgi:LPXTG-motif cell wall-anchored protein